MWLMGVNMSTKWEGLWTIPHTWLIMHSRVISALSSVNFDVSLEAFLLVGVVGIVKSGHIGVKT